MVEALCYRHLYFSEEIAKQATFPDVVAMVIYLGLPIFITTA
ncbi:hypothetical protein [Anabaena sp. CCY 9402-a]